ncbi:hypothetical protein [Alloscardovia sp. HMSC034E08]|nr:hypothetical protein [Alloscardovia sp. HMSC034E08]
MYISSRTIAKVVRGEKLSYSVIAKLCAYFECESQNIYRE